MRDLYPVAFWADVLQKPLGWKSRFVVAVKAESDLPVSLCLSLPPPPCIFSSRDPFVWQTDSNFCHHRSTVIFGPVSFCPSTIPTDQLTTAINVSLLLATEYKVKFTPLILLFWAASKELPCGGWIRPVPCAAREEGWKRGRGGALGHFIKHSRL